MAKMSDRDLQRAKLEYERDGATVLRGVVSPERIAAVGEALDRLMAPARTEQDFMTGENFSKPGEGAFFNQMFAWLADPDLKGLICDSGLAHVAGELMGASKIRFFYDQILVKEPGAKNRTPWHQDLPYWPVRGEQVISLWVAIDEATPENGVVTYVKGSHRWNRFFAMQAWRDSQQAATEEMVKAYGDLYDDEKTKGQRRSLLDVRENPQNYEFLAWSVEPGDVLVHHALTVHGANGNSSSSMRRRAVATRWFGDDARWDISRPHFMHGLAEREGFPYPHLEQGAELDAPLFPLLWERKQSVPA